MSKQRFLNPSHYSVTTKDGVRYCRYCKTKPLAGRRKSYCSDECSHEFAVRMNGSYARRCVENRDHGICSECGIDTEKISRILLLLNNRFDKYFNHLWVTQKITYDDCLALKQRYDKTFILYNYWPSLNAYKLHLLQIGFNKKHLWEADHTKPVVFGGGEAGLDNLRTLCVPCHKQATKRLRKAMTGRKISAQKETYWGKDR